MNYALHEDRIVQRPIAALGLRVDVDIVRDEKLHKDELQSLIQHRFVKRRFAFLSRCMDISASVDPHPLPSR